MTDSDLDPAELPERLGVVVHGPVVLASAPDIAAGLRCVWARPEGLLLPVVVQARGVHADAASRQVFGGAGGATEIVGSSLRVVAELGDHVAELGTELEPAHSTASAGDDDFTAEAVYWLRGVPADGRVSLRVAWPEAGLPEAVTALQLDDLDDLDARAPLLLP